MLLTRRQFAVTAAGVLLNLPAYAAALGTSRSLAEIERRLGGRVGVFALDTGSDRQLAYKADERFSMCSTFKWVLAAAVLAGIDRARFSLDQRISYGPNALLDYAPVTREHLGEGFMTLDALMEAAVTASDNTAANLLLAEIGGPAEVTRFARSLGDTVTRLDRIEPFLNSNDSGDLRDTTSPRAMIGLMRRILCGDALTAAARDRLLAWMRACRTGKDRLRAGLPEDWVAGDKTGTGQHGAANDVAVAFPPHRNPILIAAYFSEGSADLASLATAHASVGSIVAREFVEAREPLSR